MATRTKKKKQTHTQLDGAYLLKLVMYMILGAQWLRIVDPAQTSQIPIPIGLIIGFVFASHEHFKIDRKIEYAVLLVAMFVGFWSQMGIYITLS
jgi:hypothetical protein